MTANLEGVDDLVATADRKARRYWVEDGLAEIATGAMFSLVGLLFYAEARAPEGSALAGMSAILLPLVIIGGTLAAQYVVRALKERITYPRSGYVAYPEAERRRRWPAAIAAAGIGVLVAALFANAPASLAWLPALDGVVVGIFLVFLGTKLDVGRFHSLAAASIGLGLAITLAGADEQLGSAAYFGLFGLFLLAVGAWTLRSYLRDAPAAAAEA